MVVEFVFSNCLTASPPPAADTGGKKKTSTAWRSIITAATKFLVRVVVGAHSASTSTGRVDVDDDIIAERKQRAADIAAKLFATAQNVSNTVESKAADQCTDNREHLLLCAARCVVPPALSASASWCLARMTLERGLFLRARVATGPCCGVRCAPLQVSPEDRRLFLSRAGAMARAGLDFARHFRVRPSDDAGQVQGHVCEVRRPDGVPVCTGAHG